MRIEIAYGTACEQTLVGLEVEDGATVADVLRLARDVPRLAGLPLDSMPVGVFGQPVGREAVLQPGERLELYRPLAVDPKEARRHRACADGAAPHRRR